MMTTPIDVAVIVYVFVNLDGDGDLDATFDEVQVDDNVDAMRAEG